MRALALGGGTNMYQHCTDVVIHIDEELSDEEIQQLESDLAGIAGVYSACVHERARHLMLVDFDPKDVPAGMLLNRVSSHGVHAELIGL
jgi:hypothetical protein